MFYGVVADTFVEMIKMRFVMCEAMQEDFWGEERTWCPVGAVAFDLVRGWKARQVSGVAAWTCGY
jgi:hypothetical protein